MHIAKTSFPNPISEFLVSLVANSVKVFYPIVTNKNLNKNASVESFKQLQKITTKSLLCNNTCRFETP